MANGKPEISFLHCTENGSNKFYIGIIDPSTGNGWIAHGPASPSRGAGVWTQVSNGVVRKRLNEKLKKGYIKVKGLLKDIPLAAVQKASAELATLYPGGRLVSSPTTPAEWVLDNSASMAASTYYPTPEPAPRRRSVRQQVEVWI